MSTEPEESNSTSGLKVKCIITGKAGYLGSALLVDKVDEFGSLDEVAKHYICRAAGKLLRQGMSQEETRKNLGLDNTGFIPIDEAIIEKVLDTKRKKGGSPDINQMDSNGQYWWQKEEFKVKPGWNTKGGFNVEEATKDSCLRPDIYLDAMCEDCNYFTRCQLPIRRINGKVPKIEKVEKT